jgi:hypothetical protein
MKVSIITATLNSGEYLEECIRAILAQGPSEFEHIVVDGGSTDATPDDFHIWLWSSAPAAPSTKLGTSASTLPRVPS